MMSISIVIPIYNEEQRIEKCLTALANFKPPRAVEIERVIFVDDGSKDNSKIKIQKAKLTLEKKLKAKIEIISYQPNRGKGYAITEGMRRSTADYTLFMDADMSTSLNQLAKLLPHMKKGTDVIVGTRKNGISTVLKHQPLYRELLGRGFTLLTQVILNTWVSDFTCGFKAFSYRAKNAVFSKLQSEGWSFDAEALYLAGKIGFSLQEVPVVWTDRAGSKVRLLQDIPAVLLDLVRIRMRTFAQRAQTSVNKIVINKKVGA